MIDGAGAHQVVLELDQQVPPEVPVGSDIALKVRPSCSCGCDLSGAHLRLMAAGETLAACESEEFAVKSPPKPGSYSWTLLFPRQEVGGIVHEPVSLPISFVTRPLGTSLAVWDVPSPVVTGERFRVKIGAKSSAACPLKGVKVEILDAGGVLVGEGQLGDAPWEGTTALYWTDVELLAPAQAGSVSWSARFAAIEAELAHGEATACFSFAAVRLPDHRLTITFVEKETGKPIENAHIRLGPFRTMTDASGLAELAMPRGTYEIRVWHVGYEAPPTTVEVTGDVTVQLVGVALPEENPSARWMM